MHCPFMLQESIDSCVQSTAQPARERISNSNKKEGQMFTPATLLQKGRTKSLFGQLKWQRRLTAQLAIQKSPEHYLLLGHELSQGSSALGQAQAHRRRDWMCASDFDPDFTAKTGPMSQPSLFGSIQENLFTGGST